MVTTGTKFSISTMPSEEYPQIDNLNGRSGRSAAIRPRSTFSVAWYDTTLPPYENLPAEDRSGPLTDQHSIGAPGQSFAPIEETQASPASATVDPENALTMHYGRVVRTIDQNHVNQMRRLKEAHQEELGATRHAIDQAYRKELKAKNREVEKMREEMASLSATHDATVARLQREAIEQATEQAQAHQIAMDKACNAIEDVWEARWNDRIRLADEEASKTDSMYQKRLDELIAQRDKAIEDSDAVIVNRDRAWIEKLGTTHPELSNELEDIPTSLRLENSK